jgi:hypothetical protein
VVVSRSQASGAKRRRAGYHRRNALDTDEGAEPGAVSRSVPGVGVEVRFIWNEDTRSTQVYRNAVELAGAASAKRAELVAAGWIDAPPHWQSGSVS